jgi:two-component system, response regulator RegA
MGTLGMQVRSVLVVDDDVRFARGVAKVIAKARAAFIAHDATTALKLLDEHRPDLAIVDLFMPGPISGLELVSAIRVARPATYVVVYTGLASTEAVIAALEAGAHRVEEKSVTSPDVLIARVEGAATPLIGIPTLAAVKRKHIAEVLFRTNNNKSQAAKILGMRRTSLARWLKKP